MSVEPNVLGFRAAFKHGKGYEFEAAPSYDFGHLLVSLLKDEELNKQFLEARVRFVKDTIIIYDDIIDNCIVGMYPELSHLLGHPSRMCHMFSKKNGVTVILYVAGGFYGVPLKDSMPCMAEEDHKANTVMLRFACWLMFSKNELFVEEDSCKVGALNLRRREARLAPIPQPKYIKLSEAFAERRDRSYNKTDIQVSPHSRKGHIRQYKSKDGSINTTQVRPTIIHADKYDPIIHGQYKVII